MTSSPAPLVSLQNPKDVSIDELETELRNIWANYSGAEDGMSATRASTFTLLVYDPDNSQALMAALGFYTGPIDGIAGPRTLSAIKAAQKAYGMEVTGNNDDQLIQRLKAEVKKAKEQGKLTPVQENILFSPDLEGSVIADAIAVTNPCRIITLCSHLEEDEGVKAQVSAYCPIQKRHQTSLVCCEYITLQGTSAALERIGGIILALTISELPKFLWWKATPQTDYGLFKRLATECNKIVIDSSNFVADPEINLQQVGELMEKGIAIADLNWSRLASWQELTAQAFDPPERRSAIYEVDRITIDYEKGNSSQALMYLGWIASRLQWRPIGYQYQGGDYDIRKITFTNAQQRHIEAELAALALADPGEIIGDLISLRLTSTNLQADCCTVLCSQSAGCMRMEASGGAQSCRIQQVTPLSDQKTEKLLGDQLQRWGKDALYEESMKVTNQILALING